MVRRIPFPGELPNYCCALAQTPDGAALFKKHCAVCHFPGNTTRAPLPDMLALQPRQAIADSLEKGSMKAQAASLSAAERKAVVDYLAKGAVAPSSGRHQQMHGSAARLRQLAAGTAGESIWPIPAISPRRA